MLLTREWEGLYKMPKFFQNEIAAYAGEKQTFQNVKFKSNNFENSEGAELGTLLEIIPVHIKKPPVTLIIFGNPIRGR